MSKLSRAVSIHPYFKIQEGKVDAFKVIIEQFIANTEPEDFCLYYDFSLSDHVAFCREAYVDAAGVLAHLADVNAQLEAALEISELVRLEVHGPSEELKKLKQPLAGLPVVYFEHVAGLG